MNVSLDHLKSYHPMNNQVVLKPAVKMDTIQHGNLTLKAVNWDAFKSQPIVCSVVCAPRRLTYGKRKVVVETVDELDLTQEQKMELYNRRREAKYSESTIVEKLIPGSMPWKTTVQVKEGDVVWVNSNSLMNAEELGKVIEADGEPYYVLPYTELYLKKSGDDVVMLNGWLLAEVIEDPAQWMKKMESIGLIVPDAIKKQQFQDRLGVIRYAGEPVEYPFEDQYDHPEIKVGDVVLFTWRVNRRLEPGRKFFAKDADLIITRRSRIMGIMD